MKSRCLNSSVNNSSVAHAPWHFVLFYDICGNLHLGPTALISHGIGTGKNVTSYPSMKDKFKGIEFCLIIN